MSQCNKELNSINNSKSLAQCSSQVQFQGDLIYLKAIDSQGNSQCISQNLCDCCLKIVIMIFFKNDTFNNICFFFTIKILKMLKKN